MTPDKPVQEGSGSNNRQKIIVIALIVVVIFLGWQVKGMFSNGGSAPATTPTLAEAKPGASQPAGGNNMAAPGGGAPGGAAPAPLATPGVPGAPPTMPQTVSVPGTAPLSDNQLLKLQQETQGKLLDSLNTLQMLKVEREIAEMNQAIAAAKLATVTAEKSASDLLTKPAAPVVPFSAYSERFSGGGPPASTQGSIPPPPVEAQPSVPTALYVLLSVSKQFNKWNAVLGFQGKLLNVSVGDVIPIDNSKVTTITKDYIILEKEGKKTKLSLISSI